ncbi:MAG: hypothetical protein QF872_07580 [Gammaproteobacteria bacterium]|jgi:hypothetical protein|nr:hypothetical protein [Gammaproteobacteria bacterium]
MTGVSGLADQNSVTMVGNYMAGMYCGASGTAGRKTFHLATGKITAYLPYATVENVNQSMDEVERGTDFANMPQRLQDMADSAEFALPVAK